MDHVSWLRGIKNHLLEAGLNKTRRLWHFKRSQPLIYFLFSFYHVWRHVWIKIHWNSIWLRTQSHITSHYTWGGRWPHYMILEVYWDGVGHFIFGLSQFHGHGTWLMCEVALILPRGFSGAQQTWSRWIPKVAQTRCWFRSLWKCSMLKPPFQWLSFFPCERNRLLGALYKAPHVPIL